MRIPRGSGKILAVLFATLGFTVPAACQVAVDPPSPPPEFKTISPGGVNLASGSFGTSAVDLDIGEKGTPAELSLVRSYDSGLPGVYSSYAGLGAQGWSQNWASRVDKNEVPMPDGLNVGCDANLNPIFCPPRNAEVYRSVLIDGGTFKFQRTQVGANNPSFLNVGTYSPLSSSYAGAKLEFFGGEYDGYYVFTKPDGTAYRFRELNLAAPSRLSYEELPDGTRYSLSYYNNLLKSVFSNRGYALIFEYGTGVDSRNIVKACLVNLTVTASDPLGSCPAGAPNVQYQYADIAEQYQNGTIYMRKIASVIDRNGKTTSYVYDDGAHISCIQRPGIAGCQISNQYSTCLQDPLYYPQDPQAMYPELHLSERIYKQTTATGEVFIYDGGVEQAGVCPSQGQFQEGFTGTVSFSDSLGNVTEVGIVGSRPSRIKDSLGRVSSAEYDTLSLGAISAVAPVGYLLSQTLPSGETSTFTYDDRANVLSNTVQPVPAVGGSAITRSATYPASCTSGPKVCNRPTSITSGRGNTTSYTYSADNGGVLTETAPAVAINGIGAPISPVKRYVYVERYAWVKNAGGGFSHASTPVWLLSEMRTCRTTATVSGGCAGGAADELLTSYEYGSDTGSVGNNLLLRGVAMAAGGQTLRTCYGYDTQGNKISETKPRANLSVCP